MIKNLSDNKIHFRCLLKFITAWPSCWGIYPSHTSCQRWVPFYEILSATKLTNFPHFSISNQKSEVSITTCWKWKRPTHDNMWWNMLPERCGKASKLGVNFVLNSISSTGHWCFSFVTMGKLPVQLFLHKVIHIKKISWSWNIVHFKSKNVIKTNCIKCLLNIDFA